MFELATIDPFTVFAIGLAGVLAITALVLLEAGSK